MLDRELEDLLKSMPRIAEVVNKFKSEEVQKLAFQHLVQSLGLEGEVPASQNLATRAKKTPTKRLKRAPKEITAENGKAAETRRRRKKSGTVALTMLPDLNLRPSKGRSLLDFVKEKSPKTNQELYIVLVYYLEKVLKESNIGLNHIYTCLKQLGRKIPAQLGSTLTTTAARSGRIDTSSLQNLTVTIHGENFVEHDLPPKPKDD
ncbi:MAG: hypothetical protein NTZ09_02840 [Candidatus Hydrogenedentes bacterium]|nr:hypothetical protein [Candidatus Hydrogenedentota bacterium]